MDRVVAFGEIMGRLATPGYQRFQQAMPGQVQVTFAGAEASIASSIAYLGGNASFVTALPQHAIADACVASLRSLGVDTTHILRTAGGRLGLYFLETGANQRPSRIIYDREGSSISITPPDAYDWDAIFDKATWFVASGITPALSRNAMQVTEHAMQQASRRGIRIVFDMNYRSKLWRWDPHATPRELALRTIRRLLPMVDLFVGAESDLTSILETDGDVSTVDLVKGMADAFPRLSHIALTIRTESTASKNDFNGLLYDRQSGGIEYGADPAAAYRIESIVDRIGTGDAFTAGLLYAFCTKDLAASRDAIRFATAAGCLAHSVEGDFHFGSREEIEALVSGESGARVNR